MIDMIDMIDIIDMINNMIDMIDMIELIDMIDTVDMIDKTQKITKKVLLAEYTDGTHNKRKNGDTGPGENPCHTDIHICSRVRQQMHEQAFRCRGAVEGVGARWIGKGSALMHYTPNVVKM